MDAPSPELPQALVHQIRLLQHDLRRAREHYENGHLKPQHYESLHRILSERLQVVEAQVQQRLLAESRRSRLPPGFSLN